MSPHRILVVEDESIVALDLTDRLVSLGYQVAGRAASAEQAVASTREQRPALVLMDIHLQGEVDGIAAAQEIRTRFHVPVVFLTAYAEDGTLDRAKLAEPFGYILKPFEDRELKSTIEVALYKHRAEEEIRRLNRLYATLSAVSQTVVRCRSRQQLLERICRIAVEVGQFRAAWVGWRASAGAPLTVAAWHAAEPGLAALPGCTQECGLAAEAFRTGHTAVATEAQQDERSVCCHAALRQFGIGACAALPLRFRDRACGMLCVGSVEPDFFNPEEVALLEGVALDISFALDRIDDEEQRRLAEAERDRLQAHLRQAQKMEAVGRLAGGVAHDFNNLLTGIMHYVELCQDVIPSEHPARPHLNEIATEAQRSADLTRQLLAFARRQTIMPVVLNLNDTVVGTLKLLRGLIGEDIDLIWNPGVDLWPVKMDRSQLDQILVNLSTNARDAIAGVGRIAIGTANLSVAAGAGEHAVAAPGEYVLLSVADNGSGMSQDVLDHVFEPFFSTKGVGQGTGMGLATVYGIVEQNGGYIGVCSEPGAGTIFRIYLPRTAPGPKPQRLPEEPVGRPGGSETVLLVEDEKSLRVTCGKFLEALGYTVLTAATPAIALALAEQHPGAIHLLLTDVIMPGMTGPQLARRLLADRPALRCLFMSGYTADAIAQRGVLDDGVQFMQKPFSRDVLAHRVRAALAAPR